MSRRIKRLAPAPKEPPILHELLPPLACIQPPIDTESDLVSTGPRGTRAVRTSYRNTQPSRSAPSSSALQGAPPAASIRDRLHSGTPIRGAHALVRSPRITPTRQGVGNDRTCTAKGPRRRGVECAPYWLACPEGAMGASPPIRNPIQGDNSVTSERGPSPRTGRHRYHR